MSDPWDEAPILGEVKPKESSGNPWDDAPIAGQEPTGNPLLDRGRSGTGRGSQEIADSQPVPPEITAIAEQRLNEITANRTGDERGEWTPNEYDAHVAFDMATLGLGQNIAAGARTLGAMAGLNDGPDTYAENMAIQNEMRRLVEERANQPLLSSIAGAVATPSVASKVKGVKALGKTVGSILDAAGMTAVQTGARTGDAQDTANATGTAAVVASILGTTGKLGRALHARYFDDVSKVIEDVKAKIAKGDDPVKAAQEAEQILIARRDALESAAKINRRSAVETNPSMAGTVTEEGISTPMARAREAISGADVDKVAAGKRGAGEKRIDVDSSEAGKYFRKWFDDRADQAEFDLEDLQSLRTHLNTVKTDPKTPQTPQMQGALQDMFDSVQDVMEDRISKSGTDAEKAAFRQWKQSAEQFAESKALADAASKQAKEVVRIERALDPKGPKSLRKLLDDESIMKNSGMSASAIRGAKAKLDRMEKKPAEWARFLQSITEKLPGAKAGSTSNVASGLALGGMSLALDENNPFRFILQALGAHKFAKGAARPAALGAIISGRSATPVGRLVGQDQERANSIRENYFNPAVEALRGAQ